MAVMSESRVQVKRLHDGLDEDFQKRPRAGRHNPPSQVDQILVVARELRAAGTFIIASPSTLTMGHSWTHHAGASCCGQSSRVLAWVVR